VSGAGGVEQLGPDLEADSGNALFGDFDVGREKGVDRGVAVKRFQRPVVGVRA
jgi:hypothetical protein